MSLFTCPDCKHEVSSQAKACPNCGRPVTVSTKKRWTIAVISSVILLIVLFVFGSGIEIIPQLKSIGFVNALVKDKPQGNPKARQLYEILEKIDMKLATGGQINDFVNLFTEAIALQKSFSLDYKDSDLDFWFQTAILEYSMAEGYLEKIDGSAAKDSWKSGHDALEKIRDIMRGRDGDTPKKTSSSLKPNPDEHAGNIQNNTRIEVDVFKFPGGKVSIGDSYSDVMKVIPESSMSTLYEGDDPNHLWGRILTKSTRHENKAVVLIFSPAKAGAGIVLKFISYTEIR